MMRELKGMFDYSVVGDERFSVELSAEQPESGIELVHMKLHSDEAVAPTQLKLCFGVPLKRAFAVWRPNLDTDRAIPLPWAQPMQSCSTNGAPIACVLANDRNTLTIAVSDAMNIVKIFFAANEQTAVSASYVSFFSTPTAPLTDYEVTVRLDKRDIFYGDAVAAVSDWWAGFDGYTPAHVPEYARLPMYSTWYSMHQKMTAAEIEKQSALAKEVGCESIIVDDGWQTEDNSLGYAYTGDWEVCESKMGDMAAHVRRVHDIGLKYLVWYSVPFMGYKAKLTDKYADRKLCNKDNWQCYVLDPRYKEIRDYLIGTYKKALDDWDLDGFKLDFVDSFTQPAAYEELPDLGRDEQSVPKAVDTLLSDVIDTLRQTKPEIMVEFRQHYIGPLMRKYGNMFRATDCPLDPLRNRIRTIDVRLLCGSTAAHADMIKWNADERVEDAAYHIIAILFSVPQISVLLDEVPQEHREMIKFYLSLWKEYRSVLLDGKFRAYAPDQLYPVVTGETESTLFAAVYDERIVPVACAKQEIVIAAATDCGHVYVDFYGSFGEYDAVVYSCTGKVVQRSTVTAEGVKKLSVPQSGVIKLIKR